MFILRDVASTFDELGELLSAIVFVLRMCEIGMSPAGDLQLREAADWAVSWAVV